MSRAIISKTAMGTGTWGMRDKFIYHVMIRGINRQDIFEAPEPDIEIREAVIKACGLRSISDFQLLTPYPGACPHD